MKMAAELIFSVDAHISLMHSGGKPYECDQCKYSSKRAQNLKAHKLTHSGKNLMLVTSVNILPKRLKISKHTNLHTVAKSLMLVTSINTVSYTHLTLPTTPYV